MNKKRDSSWLYQQAQERFVSVLLSEHTSNEEIILSLGKISNEDIRDPRLKVIYDGCVSLAEKNSKVDTFNLIKLLESKGKLEESGGIESIEKLHEKSSSYILEGTLEDYSAFLKDFSIKISSSELIENSLESLKEDSGMSAIDIISSLQGSLSQKILESNTDDKLVSVSDVAGGYLDELEELSKLPEDSMGIPTLLPTLNRVTGGWKPGQLITIAAQTSIGKSVLGVNCAMAAALDNRSTLLFSLEMQEKEVTRRIISSLSNVPMNVLKTGRLSEEQKEQVRIASEELANVKFFIDAQLSTTLGAIKAKAKKQAQSQDGLDLVIIDYIGLIGKTGLSTKTEREQLEEITRELKLFAVELKIPIIIIAQLTRPANSDEIDNLPTKYQIRGSGGIANDSDVIILIHRGKSTDGEIPHTKIIVEKNRDGETGRIITCHSNLACSIFIEVKREKDFEDEDIPNSINSDIDINDIDSSESNPFDFDDSFDDNDDEYSFISNSSESNFGEDLI